MKFVKFVGEKKHRAAIKSVQIRRAIFAKQKSESYNEKKIYKICVICGRKTYRAAINIREICEICGQYKFRMARQRSHGVSVHSVRELFSVRKKIETQQVASLQFMKFPIKQVQQKPLYLPQR